MTSNGNDAPLDDRLREFCVTDNQRGIFDAVKTHGSAHAAARATGREHSFIAKVMRQVKARAAFAGVSPGCDNMNSPIPEGFRVKRRSARFDKEGNAAGGWVISTPDDDQREAAIREAAVAMAAELPRLDPIEKPAHTVNALCNLYTLTDCHVGMLAWAPEGGKDWDLAIAEKTLVGCFEQMIMSAPKARVAVVNQLGDFLHYDGLSPVTPSSGHVLDASSRFAEMVQASIRILRRIVDVALMRHDEVHLILAEGNHDMASSVWLRAMFAALYENEPRLTVNTAELPYYAFQHGETMLAFHHGHMKKIEQLPLMFADKFSRMWGNTTRRYSHVGHMHHLFEKDYGGMTVLQHPTLAAADAYSSRHGYGAQQSATAITYHDVHGDVGRTTVRPEMLL